MAGWMRFGAVVHQPAGPGRLHFKPELALRHLGYSKQVFFMVKLRSGRPENLKMDLGVVNDRR
jgi:hypothetical protein